MQISRRQFLRSGCAILPATVLARAGVTYRHYSRCLPDYLRGLAGEARRRREAELARLTSAAAVRQRQRWARETLWRLIGGQPERTPLNGRVVGHFERRGYRVEKVVYESQPGFFVSANVYIPAAGAPPFPAVLFQMGHALNGKAAHRTRNAVRVWRSLVFLCWPSIPWVKASAFSTRTRRGGSRACARPMTSIQCPASRCCLPGIWRRGCNFGTRCAASIIWLRIPWRIPSGSAPLGNPAAARSPCCWPAWTTAWRRPRFAAATRRISPAATSIPRAQRTMPSRT